MSVYPLWVLLVTGFRTVRPGYYPWYNAASGAEYLWLGRTPPGTPAAAVPAKGNGAMALLAVRNVSLPTRRRGVFRSTDPEG